MTTARPTDPLRAEHDGLRPHIDRLRDLGDRAVQGGDVMEPLQASVEFLHHHLLVHASAEEAVLYPLVANVLGAPRATATMSEDHARIKVLAAELADVDADDRRTIARLAYGLHTLITLHLEKEEKVYLPLLDASLSHDAVAAMYQRMEDAAATALGHG